MDTGGSIHLGVWTNWEYGSINGLTLTTDQPWRDVLVAAIALVIAFTGAQIWGVVCFAAFRFRQSPLGDHIYHYIQAALRNSSRSPTSFVLKVWEITWSQRAHHRPYSSAATTGLIQGSPSSAYPIHTHDASSERQKTGGVFGATFVRLSPLLGLAVGFSAAFTTISLLGAQFFKAPDDSALIVSQYCGWTAETSDFYNLTTPEARDTSALLLVPARTGYRRSRVYARSCYAGMDDGELAKQCDTFVTPRIGSTLTMDPACPFPGAGVCKTDSARIQSIRIDSRSTLGINTPDEDRVAVRKNLTCVPIDADQWATEWTDGKPWGYIYGDQIKAYAVGTVPDQQPPLSEYPFIVTRYSRDYATSLYPLQFVTHMPGNDTIGTTTFTPRDELKVTDSDLVLIALSSDSVFDEEIAEPWFNITEHNTRAPGYEAWFSPAGFSILGCLEQYQFCAAGFCSQPGALYQLRGRANYGLNAVTASQKAVADLVWKSLWAAQLPYALIFMGNEILVANELVMGNWYMRSSKFPTNQWAIEAWNLANISFTMLQRRPGDYAAPAAVLREDPSRIVQPETDAARALCQQIRVHTTRYTSFRVLSLALLAGVAVIMTALNFALPYYFCKAPSRGGGGGKQEAAEWDGYNIFHLIRAGCEARGIGPWDRREKTVPTMRERVRMFSMRDSPDRSWDGPPDGGVGYGYEYKGAGGSGLYGQ